MMDENEDCGLPKAPKSSITELLVLLVFVVALAVAAHHLYVYH